MPRYRSSPLVASVMVLIAVSTSAVAQSDFLRSNPRFLQTFRAVVQPLSQCTVRVQCDGKETCLGTIVGADGWILTKAHDLVGKITCRLADGRILEAKVVGVHEQHDLALLKIMAQDLRVVSFSSSKNIKAGSWVASVGSGPDAASVGVVSVPTRKVHDVYLGVLTEASPQGLVVAGVNPRANAYKAGLRSRDVIVQVNGQKLVDADQFQQILGGLKPGEAISLRFKRGDMELEIRPTLQSRQQAGDFRAEYQNRLGSELSNRRGGYEVILQHDSVLTPGDCGGALVDLQGRVIGINISRAGRVETWAIPAEIVPPLIAELKSGRLAPKEEGRGK